ncbi:MAG TPA: 50S ribosomal protein L24 [Candidatus Bathyarchaeia archaeon]|nr:50S ribosomal protein L24 [Candidatus Bathyarchaeia archaeon]
MKKNNPKLLHLPNHLRDSRVGSTLSDNLREQYGTRSCRLIKGDTVRVVRGEYSGIEGKVEKVNTQRGTLSIEGIQREKVKGGNVKVQIHSSNLIITGLNLDDKYRKNKLQKNVKQSKENADQSDNQKRTKKKQDEEANE